MNNLLIDALDIHLRTRSSYMSPLFVILDTSGSVYNAYMESACKEIQEISDIFGVNILVVYVDFKYRSRQLIKPLEDIPMVPAGGGGTDFRAGFGYVEMLDPRPELLIYFTDGQCPHFPEEPSYKVLWAQLGKEDFEPPFGRKIQVENYLITNQ